MRLQAIVFDYDGVLADTEPQHLRAFQETLAPFGIALPLAEYLAQYLGLDDEAVFRTVGQRHGRGWSSDEIASMVAGKGDRFRRIVSRALLPPGAEGREGLLYPGVAERLRTWGRELPLAIASGSLREEIEPVLEAEGLAQVIPVVVAAGETPNGKPAPDPYLRALQLLADRRGGMEPLEAARCVAVEDSPWGIDAALAAGMRVVAIATSYAADRLQAAHRVVRQFEDLDLALLSSTISPTVAIRGNGSPTPSL